MCLCLGNGGVGGAWVDPWSGRVGGVMYVCVVIQILCVDDMYR